MIATERNGKMSQARNLWIRVRRTAGSGFVYPLFAAVLWIAACGALHAQLGTGIVTGIVSDSSGLALGGATVSLTNAATNEIFTTTANTVGSYTFPPVQPGEYRVVARHDGFAQKIAEHVIVQVGSTVAVNLNLTVGKATQSVTVSAETSDLNTTTAGLGIAFDRQQIGNGTTQ